MRCWWCAREAIEDSRAADQIAWRSWVIKDVVEVAEFDSKSEDYHIYREMVQICQLSMVRTRARDGCANVLEPNRLTLMGQEWSCEWFQPSLVTVVPVWDGWQHDIASCHHGWYRWWMMKWRSKERSDDDENYGRSLVSNGQEDVGDYAKLPYLNLGAG